MKAAKRRVIESRLVAIESADWEARLQRMGAKLAEIEADREVMRRHVVTLCRATRRALNDNKHLRIQVHQLRHHKRVLLDYAIKTAVAK